MHRREDFGTNSTVRFYHGTEDDEHEGDIPLIDLFPLPPLLLTTHILLHEHEIIIPPPVHWQHEQSESTTVPIWLQLLPDLWRAAEERVQIWSRSVTLILEGG
jgi:hypothetical protein